MLFLLLVLATFLQYPNYVSPPLREIHVTSPFGYRLNPLTRQRHFHPGVDLSARKGTPILSIESGQVVFAGMYKGYGNLVVLRHPRGMTSHYAHCEAIFVSVGQQIRGQQVIAIVGDTGYATGPHLHFEVRQRGKAILPLVD